MHDDDQLTAPPVLDPDAVLARAGAAQQRAEVLRDLARETWIESLIVKARADLIALSPVVEARLQLMLGQDAARSWDR